MIDNDPIVIENVTELLEDFGYRVISTEDSQKGIQMARSDAPDLVVCDILLPVVDGFGVLETLKESADTKDIPFVFLSALDSEVLQRRSLEMGALELIQKPFSMRYLLQVVRQALGDV